MWKPYRSNPDNNICGLIYRVLVFVFVVQFLGACSDSGGENPPDEPMMTAPAVTTPVATQPVSGLAVDGPLSGATVVIQEADGDQVGTATTESTGRFNIEIPANALYPLTVRITGGTDIVTNAPATIQLAGIVETADTPHVGDTVFNVGRAPRGMSRQAGGWQSGG